MVWNGFSGWLEPLPVLVNWPVTKGTCCPTLICASWWSRVTIEGCDRMLVPPSCLSAVTSAPICRIGVSEPGSVMVPPT